MENLLISGNAQANENKNEVLTSSINPLNISEMKETGIKLIISFDSVEVEEPKEPKAINNLPALERIVTFATKGYYWILQPKTSRTGNAYLWIEATKRGEDREEFALYVNDEILNVVVAILTEKPVNISGINANDLDNFNQRIKNFEYELFMAEKAQGRTMKKTYTTNGQRFSSYYKKGVIIYKPYLNPELKAHVNA
jgi:hypothetical protein